MTARNSGSVSQPHAHTPGPWIAVENGGDDPDTRPLLVGKRTPEGFTTIADCRSRWVEDDLGGDESANARLIAAAPDLLAALESMTKKLAEFEKFPGGGGGNRAVFDQARAAIAKARG